MDLMPLFTVQLRSQSGSISHNFSTATSGGKNISKVIFLHFFGSTILLIFIFLLLLSHLLDQVIKFFIGQWLGVTS